MFGRSRRAWKLGGQLGSRGGRALALSENSPAWKPGRVLAAGQFSVRSASAALSKAARKFFQKRPRRGGPPCPPKSGKSARPIPKIFAAKFWRVRVRTAKRLRALTRVSRSRRPDSRAERPRAACPCHRPKPILNALGGASRMRGPVLLQVLQGARLHWSKAVKARAMRIWRHCLKRVKWLP